MTRTQASQSPAPLQELLGPAIRHALERIPIRSGQRVLEIGAGTGELTTHLAGLVGPHGRVIAVDKDTSHLAPTAVIDVYLRTLDTVDLPGEPDTVDIAVARWLHGPLPDPDAVIRQTIDRLRPGSWLILADLPFTPARVFHLRGEDADLIQHLATMIYSLITGNGRPTWPHDITASLVAAGMNPVCTHRSVETWTGGSPGCRLIADAAEHFRPHLIQPELSHTDLDRFIKLMADPTVLLNSYERRTVRAHKPGTPRQPAAPATRAAEG
ncbi:class I SAM-dependent methyltransferase [Micromonospora schwarzwaldensis]|uniref:class I SAM-dependent methyltransferase n=1 Tax=Micromonospora sp. DSM 45708 TaxID=3111767 RepID=UPI0031E19892